MSFTSISRRILLLVIAGFICVLVLVWANDFIIPTLHIGYDTSSAAYRQAQAAGKFESSLDPAFWAEFSVEAVLIITLGVIVLLGIRQLLARIRYLEEFMLLCASCKKVRIGKEWVPLDQYLQQRSDIKVSHSYCPDCAEQMSGAKKRGRAH